MQSGGTGAEANIFGLKSDWSRVFSSFHPMAFQGLPVELVRRIFEIPTDLPTMSCLASVCQTSYEWLMPALYSTMVIKTPRAGRCFLYLLSSKPSSFFIERVKRLSVMDESILPWVDDGDKRYYLCRHLDAFARAFRSTLR